MYMCDSQLIVNTSHNTCYEPAEAGFDVHKKVMEKSIHEITGQQISNLTEIHKCKDDTPRQNDIFSS